MLACSQSFLDTGRDRIGRLELLSTDRGLAAVLFCGSRRSAAASAWKRRVVGSVAPAAPGKHDAYERQIRQYLDGERAFFSIPLHRTGTPFQRAVLDAVSRVPFGGLASYGDIAGEVGRPGASRAVGAVNGRNPLPLVIPCHRIVGASGRLTGYGGGLDAKEWLLAHEREAGALSAEAELPKGAPGG